MLGLTVTTYPNQQFANFPVNVGFNNDLSAAKPDWIEGYLKNAFQDNSIVEQLGDAAVQSHGKFPLVLAHLVGEFERRGGDIDCGSDQAAYDAAYLVHGRNHARILMHKTDESGMAHVGSFVCDGTHLQISVHYATENHITGAIEYRQYLVFDENIRRDREHFAEGYKHLRNLQGWSRRNADMIREPVKEPSSSSKPKRETPHRACKRKRPYQTRKSGDDIIGK